MCSELQDICSDPISTGMQLVSLSLSNLLRYNIPNVSSLNPPLSFVVSGLSILDSNLRDSIPESTFVSLASFDRMILLGDNRGTMAYTKDLTNPGGEDTFIRIGAE
jgi:hypothetical protein